MLYDGNNNTTNDLSNLYVNNESGYGGYFPLGINNIWHSGIHINNMDEIRLFRPGELVAYNISEEYVETKWPKYLTEKNFSKLSENNKKIYRKTRFGGYVLNNELAGEKESNSFVLLKHNVKLSKNSNEKKDFAFFSLYMNLKPLKDISKLGNYYNKYKQMDSNLPKETFYTEWQLQIENTTGLDSI